MAELAQIKATVRTELEQIALANRMPHSLMLVGNEGYGLLREALHLSKVLMCTDTQGNGPCGVCKNCLRIEKNVHPDVHFTFPITGSNVDCETFYGDWRAFLEQYEFYSLQDWITFINSATKTPNITKKECDRISHLIQLKSYESKKKVFIIWLAEFLGKEGNRLLKMLEEPTDDTHFILITEKEERLLSTITSRCQIFQLSPLATETITDFLVQNQSCTNTEAMEAALLANGNMINALSIIQKGGKDYSSMLLELLRLGYKNNIVGLLQWAKKMVQWSKDQQSHFIAYCIAFFRETIMTQTQPNYKKNISLDEQRAANWLGQKLSLDQLFGLVSAFNEYDFYLQRNANIRVLFNNIALRIQADFKQ